MVADAARTPAQGHVIPFMELADRLLDHDFAVTFVNTEFNHRRVVVAAAGGRAPDGRLRLVGVADRMGDGEDHRDSFVRLNACMKEAMPLRLDALLHADDERLGRVTCVVVDVGMSWALHAVKRRGIPAAALWPASVTVLAVLFGAKTLIRDSVIDDDGVQSYSLLMDATVRGRTVSTHY